jgi:hypothetical protein
MVPSKDTEAFVISYTARDAAGNQALPLRRYITVNARCVLFSACSVHVATWVGQCSHYTLWVLEVSLLCHEKRFE